MRRRSGCCSQSRVVIPPTCSRPPVSWPPRPVCRVWSAGQYLDVTGTAPAGPAGLRRLHELKTGRLIAASIECVLLLAGTQQSDTITGFRAFASELGVLFQIVDDVLDVIGSQELLGKQQGSDERLGKRTYVTEFGLDGARRLAAESHERARDALNQAAPVGAAELEQITDFIATRSY